MLITPQTDTIRIKELDKISDGFLYIVSTNSITGANKTFDNQEEYFKRISALNLSNPSLVGFGIHDQKTFSKASKYLNGAIVGSAFIKALDTENKLDTIVQEFVKKIR